MQQMLSRTVESVLKAEPAATAKHLRALLGLRNGVKVDSVLRARGGLPHTAATLQAGGMGWNGSPMMGFPEACGTPWFHWHRERSSYILSDASLAVHGPKRSHVDVKGKVYEG